MDYSLDLFPTKLKEYRKAASMTQEVIAEKMGYDGEAYYCSVETGKAVASTNFIVSASKALGVPMACLLSDKRPLTETEPKAAAYLQTLSFEQLQQLNKTLETFVD